MTNIEKIGNSMRKHLDEWDNKMSTREKSIAEIEIVKNWYAKNWISYKEYIRLVDITF